MKLSTCLRYNFTFGLKLWGKFCLFFSPFRYVLFTKKLSSFSTKVCLTLSNVPCGFFSNYYSCCLAQIHVYLLPFLSSDAPAVDKVVHTQILVLYVFTGLLKGVCLSFCFCCFFLYFYFQYVVSLVYVFSDRKYSIRCRNC